MADCFRAYSKDFVIIRTWRVREREPIRGVWGRRPQRRYREQSPRYGLRGASPPEADEVFVFKTVMFNGYAAVLHKMVYYLYF